MVKPWLIDFREPRTLDELAGHMGISADLFRLAISDSRAGLYHPHRIPKKNKHRHGEYRVCFQPIGALAIAHKNLLRRFEPFAREVEPRYPHPCAHGYISDRSTRTNAEIHCGAPRVLHADVENFFPTITLSRLIALFSKLGLHPTVAEVLGKFCTIDDSLPLGLNASPLFANLICLDLDEKMLSLANTRGARYSRYADDLTFSGNADLPTRFDISNILIEEGFRLSERKFFITKRGQAHFVTGLSVTDTRRPHVPKDYKRRLRQELYYADRFGLVEHIRKAGYLSIPSGVNKIDGSIKYLFGIERVLGQKLMSKWQSTLARENMRPAYLPIHDQPIRKVTIFCDESEIATPKGVVLAIGCVTIEEVEAVQSAVQNLQRYHEADPFYVGRKAKLKKKGLHYTDLTDEVRQHYARVLAELPIRGFVAYDFLANYSTYREAYLLLLRELLLNRFVYYDRAEVSIVYEENPQLKEDDIQTAALLTYMELKVQSSRRPAKMPKAVVGTKRNDSCLSIVDTMLGVFRDYATDPTERHQGLFERLRDKYRLIISLPAHKFFTRKNPFTSWPLGDPTNS
jgi:RNA-directed DNA polymerase